MWIECGPGQLFLQPHVVAVTPKAAAYSLQSHQYIRLQVGGMGGGRGGEDEGEVGGWGVGGRGRGGGGEGREGMRGWGDAGGEEGEGRGGREGGWPFIMENGVSNIQA